MPHTPETRARAYEKMKKARADWFAENGPCRKCGSWNSLELDHIVESTKTHHAIWSWSEARRVEELKKCQPLCEYCHKKKSIEYLLEAHKGRPKLSLRKYTDEQINEAKRLRSNGMTLRDVARKIGMTHTAVWSLTSEKSDVLSRYRVS